MQGFPMDSHVTWTIDPDTGATMPEFDRAVTSEPLREYIKGVITNGVLPNPSNNLQVSAGTNGMTVLVNAGFCVIEGGLAIEPNTRTLEVTSADSTYDRIDTVVARWDSNDATRRVDLHIVRGVPASHPVRPTLTRNESIYELGLADVFVTKGIVTITNEKITDTRMESARCGICSSISEWDTTTIYQQVQADLQQFKSSEQTAFMDWFDQMKDQLSEDAAGHLQEEVDDVNKKIHTNLLNPTLGTTTVNGVTCTANGDGTYTLSGTASSHTDIRVTPWGTSEYSNLIQLEPNKKYKILGSPSGGGISTFFMCVVSNDGTTRNNIAWDYSSDGVFTSLDDIYHYEVKISVTAGTTVPNLTFKPMLTTDLSATYDDFVQYSGDGELNQNVAEMYNMFFDIAHPVGELIITTDASFNPNTAKGWKGTWERDKGRFVRLAGDGDTIGSTGGADERTLTTANLPSHYHEMKHTHGIPKLSMNTTGNHGHYVARVATSENRAAEWGYASPSHNIASNSTTDLGYILKNTNASAAWTGYSSTSGDHTHTTNASTTNSQSTNNTSNTGSGTAFDNRPFHENFYGWVRVS